MKDSEFIELLNLYLDHEITPADAARLEAEVLGNAKRREIYRDYCRIQKGCKLLAQEFATETVPAEEGKVVAFEAAAMPARRMNWYVGGGFAAAAACVAFVFIASNRTPELAPGDAQPVLAQQASPAPAAAERIAAQPANATERRIGRTVTMPEASSAQPAFVNALTLAGTAPEASASSLLLTSERDGAQFEWIDSMQLAPVQRVSIDEFRFDSRTPLRTQNAPYVAPRGPQGGQMEWNAIRYRK